MKSTHVLLVGTGAVGSYYGGRLAQSGVKVSALCRSDYKIVKKSGISIESHRGDFHFKPHQVIQHARELKEKPDYILICLKVLPEIDTPSIIAPVLGPETSIVLLQNGVDIEEKFVHAFPKNEIISGIAFIAVSRISLGIIKHLDYGRITLGSYPKGISAKSQQMIDLFKQAGVPCNSTESIEATRWQKLVWNVPFNPISVLGGVVDTSQIMANEEMVSYIEKIMKEVVSIAEKLGHNLPDNVIEKNIADTKVMKPYLTSMALDFLAGRRIEVEAILGNALRKALCIDLPVPYIESLYQLLNLVDRKQREK